MSYCLLASHPIPGSFGYHQHSHRFWGTGKKTRNVLLLNHRVFNCFNPNFTRNLITILLLLYRNYKRNVNKKNDLKKQKSSEFYN